MVFNRISYWIALQFTAFVFILLLLAGSVFLVVDLRDSQRQTQFRLERLSLMVMNVAENLENNRPMILPPGVKDRVRITDVLGNTIYTGSLFTDIAFRPQEGFSQITIEGEEYTLATTRVTRGTKLLGYVQVMDIERQQRSDLPQRALNYIIISLAISAVTFFVGLFFARRSLKPAEMMVERLEQFTQDASHELKTPLATLSSSLDLALRTGRHREGLLSAKNDVKDVTVLIERLLELARLDTFALQVETVDLSLLEDQIVDKFQPLASEYGIAIKKDIVPGITVDGDASLLKQVIGNLLSNAIKFSKPHGKNITITLTKNDFSIRDEGIGMPASSMKNLFDRFYQVDPSRSHGGYGLGLAVVKRIVDLHGWTVTIESNEGKGTTVTVAFLNTKPRKRS